MAVFGLTVILLWTQEPKRKCPCLLNVKISFSSNIKHTHTHTHIHLQIRECTMLVFSFFIMINTFEKYLLS